MFKRYLFIITMMITQKIFSINQNMQKFKIIAGEFEDTQKKKNPNYLWMREKLEELFTLLQSLDKSLEEKDFESSKITQELIDSFGSVSVNKILNNILLIYFTLATQTTPANLEQELKIIADSFKRYITKIHIQIVQKLTDPFFFSNQPCNTINQLIECEQLKLILHAYEKKNPTYTLLLLNHDPKARYDLYQEILNLLFFTEEYKKLKAETKKI